MTSDLGTVHTPASLTTVEQLLAYLRQVQDERDSARAWAVRLEQEAHDAHEATRALIEDRERAEATIKAQRFKIRALLNIEPLWDMAVADVALLNGD